MKLYWIYMYMQLSFARIRVPLNIQIKLTNFVRWLNCVSLKSSKTMTFLVGGKIEFLCLFAIQDAQVTGEKSSNLKENYSRQRMLSKYGMLTSFVLSLQFQDSLKPSRTPKK